MNLYVQFKILYPSKQLDKTAEYRISHIGLKLKSDNFDAIQETPYCYKKDKYCSYTTQKPNQPTPRSRVLLEKLTVIQPVKKSPAFMETEGSSPRSQQPATGPYPEPDESSPHPPTLFSEDPF
jgi:hypothetical protein